MVTAARFSVQTNSVLAELTSRLNKTRHCRWCVTQRVIDPGGCHPTQSSQSASDLSSMLTGTVSIPATVIVDNIY